MKATQDRQKSYVDQHYMELLLEVGDHVFLKVSLTTGSVQFGTRGKLSLRVIGPFKISDRVGLVVYRLSLSPHMSAIHPAFHVSVQRRYIHDSSHVIRF